MDVTPDKIMALAGELAVVKLLLEDELSKARAEISELKLKLEATPIEDVEFDVPPSIALSAD